MNDQDQTSTQARLARIIEIQRELDIRKELYAELDRITLELVESGFASAELEGLQIDLVDNFAEGKNTVFRPAGVKRFELKVSDPSKPKRSRKGA
jgi:hypothetical protein